MKDYEVKLGFGLHLGYSIEGAIGSLFKIDTSYLSPNVNMASKLEERTKDYGASIILSEDFVNHLSEEVRPYLRIIDSLISHNKVLSKDLLLILDLYTVDLDLSMLKVEEEDEMKNEDEIARRKRMVINILLKFQLVKKKQKRSLKEDCFAGNIRVWDEFIKESSEFRKVRESYTDLFYETYNAAFDLFRQGEWEEAAVKFEEAQVI
jgi:hypothetical protein